MWEAAPAGDRMDEDRLALIKKALPRPADAGFPVDLFDTPWPDHPKLFLRTVVKPWGRFAVLAVYNFGPEPLRLPVALDRLGRSPNADYLVWEFWDERYVGRVRHLVAAEVGQGHRLGGEVEGTGRADALALQAPGPGPGRRRGPSTPASPAA